MKYDHIFLFVFIRYNKLQQWIWEAQSQKHACMVKPAWRRQQTWFDMEGSGQFNPQQADSASKLVGGGRHHQIQWRGVFVVSDTFAMIVQRDISNLKKPIYKLQRAVLGCFFSSPEMRNNGVWIEEMHGEWLGIWWECLWDNWERICSVEQTVEYQVAWLRKCFGKSTFSFFPNSPTQFHIIRPRTREEFYHQASYWEFGFQGLWAWFLKIIKM